MTPIPGITDPRERLLAFARERHAIWERRQANTLIRNQAGLMSWTCDPILAAYRFTNVYRELDKVTVWIAQNWRGPHADDPDIWFAMVVARFVNRPETLAEVGYPVPWRPQHFLRVMAKRKRRGLKLYGGAYLIGADSGTPGRPTAEYQVAEVFNPMWNQRERLRPRGCNTLNSYHMLLGQLVGLSSFMAGQVVADLRYVEPLRSADDWETFACSGPGSRRGLNRILGRPVKSPWTEDDWRLENERLRIWFNGEWVDRFALERLHGQDMNNVECEFDKMERVRLGEGRPRARYP